MNRDKLMLVLIALVGFIALISFVNTLGLAMLAYEVKPLISKVDSKLDSLEMPDFSNVNELMSEVKPLLELVEEFNDPITKYYVKEFKAFLQRFDDIQGSDLMISLLPAMNKSYANRSCLK